MGRNEEAEGPGLARATPRPSPRSSQSRRRCAHGPQARAGVQTPWGWAGRGRHAGGQRGLGEGGGGPGCRRGDGGARGGRRAVPLAWNQGRGSRAGADTAAHSVAGRRVVILVLKNFFSI